MSAADPFLQSEETESVNRNIATSVSLKVKRAKVMEPKFVQGCTRDVKMICSRSKSYHLSDPQEPLQKGDVGKIGEV